MLTYDEAQTLIGTRAPVYYMGTRFLWLNVLDGDRIRSWEQLEIQIRERLAKDHYPSLSFVLECLKSNWKELEMLVRHQTGPIGICYSNYAASPSNGRFTGRSPPPRLIHALFGPKIVDALVDCIGPLDHEGHLPTNTANSGDLSKWRNGGPNKVTWAVEPMKRSETVALVLALKGFKRLSAVSATKGKDEILTRIVNEMNSSKKHHRFHKFLSRILELSMYVRGFFLKSTAVAVELVEE